MKRLNLVTAVLLGLSTALIAQPPGDLVKSATQPFKSPLPKFMVPKLIKVSVKVGGKTVSSTSVLEPWSTDYAMEWNTHAKKRKLISYDEATDSSVMEYYGKSTIELYRKKKSSGKKISAPNTQKELVFKAEVEDGVMRVEGLSLLPQYREDLEKQAVEEKAVAP